MEIPTATSCYRIEHRKLSLIRILLNENCEFAIRNRLEFDFDFGLFM